MKYILISLFLFSIHEVTAQRIAFVNESALIDSCLKYKYNGKEEIQMMETILNKKIEESRNEIDPEKQKIYNQDIEEYKKRIEDIKVVISKKEETNDYYQASKNDVQKTAKKLQKKLKYSSYVDISEKNPMDYNQIDDITNEIWEVLKK
jgi:hypothetical protein